MINEVYFNFPKASYLLLLLVPLFIFQFILLRYRKKKLHAYAPGKVLPSLLTPRSFILTLTKMGGWLLIWALACMALMEPFGNIRPSVQSNPSDEHLKSFFTPHEVIFLVDTSASMGVPDSIDGNTRLEEAKNIMEDMMRQLNGQTVSLYAFTSELSSIVPPTLDYLFARLSMKELHLDEGDVGGTRFAPILKSLQEQAFPQPLSKRYSIIMLSDGGDTQLEALTGEAKKTEQLKILNAVSNPQEFQIRLFTIGIGSLQPSPIPHATEGGKPVLSKLEPDILKELAKKNLGKYETASDWTSWDLASELKKEMGDDPLISPQKLHEKDSAGIVQNNIAVDWYFQIPLGLALLFYIFNLWLPDVRKVLK